MASYQFMDQILLEEPLGSFLFHALLLPTSCSYFIFFLSLKTELRTCNVSCPSPKGSLLRLLTDISVWEAPACFLHLLDVVRVSMMLRETTHSLSCL